MTAHEFTPWPKTARLFRNTTVTEKLDGTNVAINISAGYEVEHPAMFELKPGEAIVEGRVWRVSAQSRTRIITPGKGTDNFGFAAWVYENAAALVSALGEGLHFGEWWGRGIQRGYGLDERRFSLFNTDKHRALSTFVGGVLVQPVPVLWVGTFDTEKVSECLRDLRDTGSEAAPGFMNPEGICVFVHATRQVLKATLDDNDAGKWES